MQSRRLLTLHRIPGDVPCLFCTQRPHACQSDVEFCPLAPEPPGSDPDRRCGRPRLLESVLHGPGHRSVLAAGCWCSTYPGHCTRPLEQEKGYIVLQPRL